MLILRLDEVTVALHLPGFVNWPHLPVLPPNRRFWTSDRRILGVLFASRVRPGSRHSQPEDKVATAGPRLHRPARSQGVSRVLGGSMSIGNCAAEAVLTIGRFGARMRVRSISPTPCLRVTAAPRNRCFDTSDEICRGFSAVKGSRLRRNCSPPETACRCICQPRRLVLPPKVSANDSGKVGAKPPNGHIARATPSAPEPQLFPKIDEKGLDTLKSKK